MRAGLASIVDRRKLAVAGARFRAWWDGEDFDEAALPAIETPAPAPDDPRAIEDVLFEAEPDPRLQALQLIWGEGRVAPGCEADEAAQLALLHLGEAPALALLGPGLSAPVAAFSGANPTIFEWRAETRAALSAALPGARIEPFDLDVTPLPHDAFDGLISFDEATYGYAPHLALQMARAVKPGARALMEAYVGPPGPDLAHAFASAFAEPQVRPRPDLEHAVTEAGFDIESEEDLTEAHIARARAGFEALTGRMSGPDAPPLHAGAARELAWETETWRVRLRMLARRRLERHRLVLRRRA